MTIDMFKIHADYRKNNPHKNYYYVRAKTRKEAKQKFNNLISWLDIYTIEDCGVDEMETVLNNPRHYIMID